MTEPEPDEDVQREAPLRPRRNRRWGNRYLPKDPGDLSVYAPVGPRTERGKIYKGRQKEQGKK